MGMTLGAPGPGTTLRGEGCRRLGGSRAGWGRSPPPAVTANHGGYVGSELGWGTKVERQTPTSRLSWLGDGGPDADPDPWQHPQQIGLHQ